MINLPEKISAEIDNIEKSLANLSSPLKKKKKSIIEIAGMAAFIQNIYNGIENILKQILKSKNVSVAHPEIWHKELLEKSVKNNIIPDELAEALYEYLTFRHFFIHSYSFMLDKKKVVALANNINKLWQKFLGEIKPYR
ncbi:hypothetical protein A2291_06615 [candidate division WOR-1 bacterium RIFOXYB2_FULL_42_35]|uniref:HepT-like domain-containing protein n=1 Tax=candidate division WOR-1 bacterium RIFOXYC2_FULL_41_25 TaxID=1802586 RepID=A0A1F4TPI4_UNCSA|nr:MAG: hypothetical protein A2291_06615 [candidate division WOR-1 bacterium RIFOXYB2_FULL_42_35]OGC24553.1 MAG: hypothetical protein A2247_06395 [candidate division WOR-1 bacterium RIFOXYA2_FULL_41_14]OGC34598.1 MAG: hypothetical protein A2462_04630 [candidate division WOR-1 bacterium RIFOXYC2_FULL_41_25]OGC43995.1 MAG: hypothetical protein A2548_06335 [candidate division WOR-1 bacterium RIFOXYD2_FULL_41_8]